MLSQTTPLFLACFLLLAYYVYQDIKYREINIVPIFIVCILSVIYLLLFVFKNNTELWTIYLFQILFSFIFVFIIFIFGNITKFAYVGEGDLLVILLISFTSGFIFIFSQFVFLLALVLMLFIPVLFFIYNLINKNYPKYKFVQNVFLMFLGTKKKLSKITDFYTPLEKLKYKNQKLVREPQIMPNCEPKAQIRYIKSIAKNENITEIWVSPLIPFIVTITVSYVILSICLFLDVFSKYGIVSFL